MPSQESFSDRALARIKKMERLLRENFQAEGHSLRVSSRNVQDQLDDDTFRKIEFIGAIRNNLVHIEHYVFDGNEEEFLNTCDEVLGRLSRGKLMNQRRVRHTPALLQLTLRRRPKELPEQVHR